MPIPSKLLVSLLALCTLALPACKPPLRAAKWPTLIGTAWACVDDKSYAVSRVEFSEDGKITFLEENFPSYGGDFRVIDEDQLALRNPIGEVTGYDYTFEGDRLTLTPQGMSHGLRCHRLEEGDGDGLVGARSKRCADTCNTLSSADKAVQRAFGDELTAPGACRKSCEEPDKTRLLLRCLDPERDPAPPAAEVVQCLGAGVPE
ncbi:MAG: hypothetical protein AUK47_03900 [Deltaproteobacteria bacterium CG2_30_63_29]|nr:MAG: hypothetical protein AUK47_03900 [Deltaproteobacteria bacterium CG2_30_63_29]PJB39860.1 MAG: hypothetical protein CO108_16305 [Deltaproteobacteria bacterium CG_4_9_14_3_um_filter_63_12]